MVGPGSYDDSNQNVKMSSPRWKIGNSKKLDEFDPIREHPGPGA